MSQKHYLITGGAGFIGSHLTERILKEGHRVTVIDDFNTYYDPEIKHRNIAGVRDQIELVEGDIRDAILVERTFAKGKFDHVIHIAARAGVRPSIKDPKLYFTSLLGLPASEKAIAFKMLREAGIPILSIPTNKVQLALKAIHKIKSGFELAIRSGSIGI